MGDSKAQQTFKCETFILWTVSEAQHAPAALYSVNIDMLYQLTSLGGIHVCLHANDSQTNILIHKWSEHLCTIYWEVILTQRSMETTVNVIHLGSVLHYQTIIQGNRLTHGY